MRVCHHERSEGSALPLVKSRSLAALVMTTGTLVLTASSRAQVPRDQWREPPNTPLVTVERIAKYGGRQKAEWYDYLRRSRELHVRDTAAMAKELRAAHQSKMTQAPYVHDFALTDSMSASWFSSDSAQRMAEVILSFQAPNGGWSKHVDFRQHPRQTGESFFGESDLWEWISTIDNNSTTEEIRFLMRANQARRDKRYEEAIVRGLEFLTASQYPNGCFPQVYPLQGGYHDGATFNDDATINVLRLMNDVRSDRYPYLHGRTVGKANVASLGGIRCILDSQIRVNGTLTAWGQQHDPLTLEPIAARTYELKSISALESASIVDFLMSIPNASPNVVRSVDAAVAWMTAVPLQGLTYSAYELKASPETPPLWGRLYEIGTNRVIMANRDGVKLYDWDKLTDRRSGYRWYGTQPAATIARYKEWKAKRSPRN
jgi:PelA/Pel-15E family pectate lyase